MRDRKLTIARQVVQAEGNIASGMGEDKVMLNVQRGKYYNLGPVGGAIWDRIREPIAIDQLVGSLLAVYKVDPTECEEQVLEFLEKLLEEGLIRTVDEAG
ncbi:lasso peptide biosynthesis PqqD family chaperone [Cohnella lubricantis]|uniref:Lasso peptide biosynthesis PqqD family chaperone n=1 Tax=Cohnella lubricantis TaxID=2163172 RepID=A0A841T673_9BACL|nr:lasso peptide biosynthesis PqqD family chaperone [Cohnella lubricantis]MBB6676824.1 lasso peptide biosynthesis PqqD family chaperone [Cohnella lubricantis]MBP2119403.1 hypothetical protein [Cohnella lubricantis]